VKTIKFKLTNMAVASFWIAHWSEVTS